MNTNSFISQKSTRTYHYTNSYQNLKPPPFNGYKYKKFEEDFSNYQRNDFQNKVINRSLVQNSYKENTNSSRILTKKNVQTNSKTSGTKYIGSSISINNNIQYKSNYSLNKLGKKEIEKNANTKSPNSIQISAVQQSPVYFDIQNSVEIDESGYKTKKDYKYTSSITNSTRRGHQQKNEKYEYHINKYEGSIQSSPGAIIFSPSGYVGNYSSGSDEEQRKSFEYINQKSVQSNSNYKNNNNNNISRKIPQRSPLNYEIEDPENFDYIQNNDRNFTYINRSQVKTTKIKDSIHSEKINFQSPDRNSQNESKRFRNVNIGQISSKGPTNDDKKVTKIMKREIISTSNQDSYSYSQKRSGISTLINQSISLTQVAAAKIIQAWWRRRNERDQEVYDITVKKAVKLQSIIRGYLVRKKVLRYITLAIYYQSFCDKLQDVLCNNVKKEIFSLLKKNKNIKIQKKPKKNKTIVKKTNQQITIIKKEKLTSLINKKNNINNKILSIYFNKWKNKVYITITTNRVNHVTYKSKNNTKSINKTKVNKITTTTTKTMQSNMRKIIPVPRQTIKQTTNNNYSNSKYSSKFYYNGNIVNYKQFANTYNNLNKSTLYSKNISHIVDNKYQLNNSVNVVNVRNLQQNKAKLFNVETGYIIRPSVSIERGPYASNRLHKDIKSSYSYNINRRHETITRSPKIEHNKYIDHNLIFGKNKTDTKIITTKRITTSTVPVPSLFKVERTTKKITKNKHIPRSLTNEIISGGTLSIVKLPNRKTSQDITNEKKITVYKEDYSNIRTTMDRYTKKRFGATTIDNQLSVNIIKLPEKPKPKEVRIIREIIHVDQPKPEMVEEGTIQERSKLIRNILRRIVKIKIAMHKLLKDKYFQRWRNTILNDKILRKRKVNDGKNKLRILKNILKIPNKLRKRLLRTKFNQFIRNCLSLGQTFIEYYITRPVQVKILKNKPMMCEQGINVDNSFLKEISLIERNKILKEKKKIKPKIIKNQSINIIGKSKIKTKVAETNTENYSKEASTNTRKPVNYIQTEEEISIIKKPKILIEKENQYECPRQFKKHEIKIRTMKRSLTKFEVPILRKLWLRKAFNTFRDNCKRPALHKIIGRELVRMAFLRWRFINGYGPNRYGIIYDRNGNIIGRTTPVVCDEGIQESIKPLTIEGSTQYTSIENVISKLKQINLNAIYTHKASETNDIAVGDNLPYEKVIIREGRININKLPKPKNSIDYIRSLQINKVEKKFVNEGTEIELPENKVEYNTKITLTNDDYKLLMKNNSRIKDLLIKIIYRRLLGDKLKLCNALRNWLKNILYYMRIEQEEYDKRHKKTSVNKNTSFSISKYIHKVEEGTQMNIKKNEISKGVNNLQIIDYKELIDMGVDANFAPTFNIEDLGSFKENNEMIKSNKKPMVLKAKRADDIIIYSEDYIFQQEVINGKHHPLTDEARKRIAEILYKYFSSRGPKSILRKYFTIWNRKAKLLTLLDNARIIAEFCEYNFKTVLASRLWKKLVDKYIIKERIKIIKTKPYINQRKRKLFDLIRLTRLNIVYSKRRYLHYILLSWLAYTRNLIKKREHVKLLYENMLNTYMNMADDVFGNNQKENPSVQDALFEVVESDKFLINDNHDVPIAEEYYKNKKEEKKVITNISYVPVKEEKKIEEIETYEEILKKGPIKQTQKVIIEEFSKRGGAKFNSRVNGRRKRNLIIKDEGVGGNLEYEEGGIKKKVYEFKDIPGGVSTVTKEVATNGKIDDINESEDKNSYTQEYSKGKGKNYVSPRRIVESLKVQKKEENIEIEIDEDEKDEKDENK